MSIRHGDKCTRGEAALFCQVVEKWLKQNRLPFKKLRALTSYEGEVRIYTGTKSEPTALKRSRKCIAYKAPDGI